MDVVRYFLAISIVISHVNVLMGYEIWWPLSAYTCVGAFFALSGFLIYPSYQKHKRLSDYVKTRARRILPSYFFIVIVCAVGLVAVSSLPAVEYFSSSGFWGYLAANLSFLNFLHPGLPGVFDDHRFVMPAVNGALWTMKIEWMLYLSFPIAAYVMARLRSSGNRMIFLFGVLIVSITYRAVMNYVYIRTGNSTYDILGRQFFGQLSYFYTGIILYFKRDWLLRNKWTVLTAVLALLIAEDYVPQGHIVLAPLWVSTAVVWVSVVGDWGRRLSRSDNVSYDIYLFHFPIIQLAIYAGLKEWPWWCSCIAVLTVTIVLAVTEWRFVGKLFYRRRLRG